MYTTVGLVCPDDCHSHDLWGVLTSLSEFTSFVVQSDVVFRVKDMCLNAPRGLSECVTDGQQSSDQSSDGPAEMSDNQTWRRRSAEFFLWNDFQNKRSVWRSISDELNSQKSRSRASTLHSQIFFGHYSWTSSKQKIIIINIIWGSG